MSIGIWQIALILVVVVLIFGAGKLPRVMGDFAKGIKSFKAGMKDEEAAPSAKNPAPGETGTVTRVSGTADASAAKKKDESAQS